MPDDQNPQSNPQNPVTPLTGDPNQMPPEDTSFPAPGDLPPLTDAPTVENQPALNTAASAGDNPPLDIPPVVSPPPKKRLGGKAIVAGVLGLLLLVGGIGAGIILVRQQQDIREKAAVLDCVGEGGQCVPTDYVCTGGVISGTNCSSNRKCGLGSCTAPSTTGSCSGTCENTSCQNLGKFNGTGICPGSGICCTNTAPPPPASNTCTSNGGTCWNAPGGCASIGQTSVSGSCSGGQVCCTLSTTCTSGTQRDCTVSSTNCPGKEGCSNGQWNGQCIDVADNCPAQAPPPQAPPPVGGSASDCRYTNDGSTVGTTGNCAGYTFRALQFDCNGPLSLSPSGRCEDKGIHPGFETMTEKGSGPVSIGSVPNCKSRQVDIIVTGRPNDGLSGDALPGSPAAANYIANDGSQAGCNVPPPPASAPPNVAGSCQQIKAYDTNWAQLGPSQLAALQPEDKVRFAVRGSSTGGSFTKAIFKINNVDSPEVAGKKPGTEEFFYEYTIPTGTTSFTIKGYVFHNSLGWRPAR